MYIGPIYEARPRDHNPFEDNMTASLTDSVYSCNGSSVKYSFETYQVKNGSEVAEVPSNDAIIEAYEPVIKEHVERRLQAFFQQLIVCYRTGLHFENKNALDQAKSGNSIVLKKDGQEVLRLSREAAHSATLPCLVAYDKAKWDANEAPPGFVFLKDSDYYYRQNSTICMPEWVNEVDTLIDGKRGGKKLRDQALALLNRASMGEVTPDQGIRKFVQVLLGAIEDGIENSKYEEHDSILDIYLTKIKEFEEITDGDLEALLSVKFEGEGSAARRTILKLRYAAIKGAQFAQAEIISKVNSLRDEILPLVKGSGSKPAYFEQAFKTRVVEQARTDADGERLSKLLNFSPEALKAQIKMIQGGETTFTKTNAKLKPHIQRINFVVRELLTTMRHLRIEERNQRSKVTKELRSMRDWTQASFGEKLRRAFPNAASSRSTISDIETGKRPVTAREATQFSRVFDVDPGLFMPHFFYA